MAKAGSVPLWRGRPKHERCRTLTLRPPPPPPSPAPAALATNLTIGNLTLPMPGCPAACHDLLGTLANASGCPLVASAADLEGLSEVLEMVPGFADQGLAAIRETCDIQETCTEESITEVSSP